MEKTRREEIELQVDTLFQKISYNNKQDEVDIIKIAESLDFAIGNAVLDNDDDGFILVQDGAEELLGIKTDKLIGVNSKQPLEWKRFIIAHELGHYFLHYLNSSKTGMFAHRDHRKGKNNKENDADYFAAALLMPRKKFSERYKELEEKKLSEDDIIFLLAEKFQVTPNMARRRIGELELNAA